MGLQLWDGVVRRDEAQGSMCVDDLTTACNRRNQGLLTLMRPLLVLSGMWVCCGPVMFSTDRYDESHLRPQVPFSAVTEERVAGFATWATQPVGRQNLLEVPLPHFEHTNT